MLFSLIAMVTLGVGFAGMIVALRRTALRNLPRWIVPAGAGAAMLAFAVWNDYSWFSRTQAGFPPEVVVATTVAPKDAIQPWSYLAPRVTRFTAVDRREIKPLADGLFYSPVIFVQRYAATKVAPMIVDCAANRWTDAAAGAQTDLTGAHWFPLGLDDGLLAAVCSAPKPAQG